MGIPQIFPEFHPVFVLQALDLLDDLSDSADLVACNACLSALARSGQWQKAGELLRTRRGGRGSTEIN